MSTGELWKELEKESLSKSRFFWRSLVAIPIPHFEKYKDYFIKSYNPINKKLNFRTRGFFKHIHVIQSEKYIEFHIDYFNPAKSILLSIPHLVVDVLPYFLSFTKKPYKM